MSMARGKAVWVVLVAVGLLGAGTPIAAAKPIAVKRTIGNAGVPIPRSVAGLASEYPSTQDYFGAPGKPNAPCGQLLRTLGENGAGAPTIRLGGNSGDASW